MTDPRLQFHADRPTDLRRPTPWHRLSFIVRALPARISALSAELRVPPGGRVLDYGCAEVPYRGLFGDVEYLAADLPGNPAATVEIRQDGTLPVDDASVDAILSTQVLEHVADPGVYLAECARVLRPGGRMLLSTHGLMVYHPDPDDYWRWTGAGLQRAVRDAGFRVVRFEGIMGLAATALQLLQDGIYWRLPVLVRPLLALVLQTLAKIADRFDSDEARASNALVFALVAERP